MVARPAWRRSITRCHVYTHHTSVAAAASRRDYRNRFRSVQRSSSSCIPHNILRVWTAIITVTLFSANSNERRTGVMFYTPNSRANSKTIIVLSLTSSTVIVPDKLRSLKFAFIFFFVIIITAIPPARRMMLL